MEEQAQQVIEKDLSGGNEPEAKTFTQDDLNRIATKEAKKVEQTFLKQLELEKKEDLPTTIEEFKAFRQAKANKETIEEKYTALDTNYKNLNDKYQQTHNELSELKKEKILNKKGITNDVDYYVFKINKLVSDEVDFEQATELYLKDNPINPVKKEFYAGAGKKKIINDKVDMNSFIRGKNKN